MGKNITFRSHLIGSISDFSESCNLGDICRPSILVELIVALSRYREEGAKLAPDVYLCASINDVAKLILESEIIRIGEADISEIAIKDILKKTAPIAIDGWRIFIEQKEINICYGVFRDSLMPLAVPIENVLFGDGSDQPKIIRIHQTAEGCVEIRNYTGMVHNIIMSHMKDSAPVPTKNIDDLVESICEKVVDDNKESIKTFVMKSVSSALASCHGTLVAVATSNKIPQFLTDSVPLDPPIDFAKNVIDVLKTEMPPQLLIAHSALLKGMMNCDGILLFDRNARLLAYNCFLSALPGSKGPPGGARRRAFLGLINKLEKGVSAAFIQSQDGWSDFRKVTK